MKPKIIFLIFLIPLLTACSNSETGKTIKVGALSAPNAEILELAIPEIKKNGYDLEIIEFSDIDKANDALENGEIDANYIQTEAFLEEYNKENGTELTSIGKIHYEPTALYGGRAGSVHDIRKGSQILIPADRINQARALLLLNKLKYIKLKNTESPTLDDITENPYEIEFRVFPANEIPRELENADMGVINGNNAIEAALDLNGEYALAVEDKKVTKKNPIELVVKKANMSDEKVQILLESLMSDSVKSYIDETYNGNAVSNVR